MSDPSLRQRIADPIMAECPSCGQACAVRWVRADTNEPAWPICGRCQVRMVQSTRSWRWEVGWRQDGDQEGTSG